MHTVSFDAWKDFFTAAVSATAALTGLVFVALSINLSKILTQPGLSARGGETLILLAAALFTALMTLIPGQPSWAMAIKFGVIGLFAWGVPTVIHVGAGRLGHYEERWQYVVRVVLHQVATLPFVLAAFSIFFAINGTQYLLASGVLLALGVGLFNAWILLVEIVR
jgi:hypothetical protein